VPREKYVLSEKEQIPSEIVEIPRAVRRLD
jgi:hypothetical protein